MTTSRLYHDGSRALQDQFDSRRLADHWEEKITSDVFSDVDKEFIESSLFFFLATADAAGRPDCSFKGGTAGFVRVTGPSDLIFPDYDGNGMFKSLGNIRVNPSVGLLFIAMGDKPRRLRVNGEASITRDDPSMRDFAGAQLLVRVAARVIFPNCPRYIPALTGGTPSQYAPRTNYEPPEPAWKQREGVKDKLPPHPPR
jgi:predicted pyridoxine 5'-phosphate oxidase superfamily flavin-nucleotide-binding protein